MSSDETEVVLTPLKGIEPGSHVMRIERLLASQLNKANVHHFAGGPYQGIIINKATQEETSVSKPDTVRMFTAYVADTTKDSKDFTREKRVLKFWFEELAKVDKQVTEAITDTFFKELLNPDAFPKDYINFVKRVLNLVKQYSAIQKLELIMRKLLEGEGDEGMVVNRTLHVTRTVVTSRKVTTVKGQDEFIRQADGSVVDTHGNVILTASDAAKMETGQVLIMKNGHIQEDYRRLADGTIVDSHGDIVTGDVQVMMMQPGGILTRYQQEYVTNGGLENGFEPNATSTTKRGQLKKQPTITRKGWDLIWATKKQRLIQILEDAYPTVMTMDDLVSHSSMKRADVEYLMDDLTKRGLVRDVDKNRFIRIPEGRKLVIRQGTTQRSSRQSADLDSTLDRSTLGRSMDVESKNKRHEFKLVAHIPHLPAKDQPVIAIVTLLFCEKVAVDAMMDSKTTYIRIKKGEGEGQVYTVGKIGPHIVVSTKLSRIGHGEGAMMAAGNTVTRLLGTFGQIEHVILVGVGGGVISLDNDSKHVRLGDIVASKVEKQGDPAYIHCNEATEDNGKTSFKKKSWTPKDLILEKIMMTLKRKSTDQFFAGEWDKYIAEGYEELSGGDTKYSRPPPESDKLYKVEANKEVEIQHPTSPIGSPRARDPTKPVLFLGKIGAGKNFSKNDSLRQAFITDNDCLCIDSGFQAVMQSIEGNRKDSFAVIRGISDYQDGTHRREWQPYASLVAAAFMKAVILQLSHEEEDEED